MKKDFEYDNISISHQTINNKLCKVNNTNLVKFEVSEVSGLLYI
jgi:hypothetical protein